MGYQYQTKINRYLCIQIWIGSLYQDTSNKMGSACTSPLMIMYCHSQCLHNHHRGLQDHLSLGLLLFELDLTDVSDFASFVYLDPGLVGGFDNEDDCCYLSRVDLEARACVLNSS